MPLRDDGWASSIAATKALVAAEASTVYSDFFGRWVRVLRVGKAITSDYHTISDALSNSQRFDRIEVESGSYYESISIPHSVELTTSDVGEEVFISTRGPCVTIATDEPVAVSRLTVVGRGQRQADCVAVMIVRGSPTIRDCLLSAVHVCSYATPVITHCTIENCESGSGLRLMDHCGGEYTYNDIRFHRTECVKIACCGRPVLRKNRIYQKSPLMSVINIAGGRYGAECAPILEDNLISGTEHVTSGGSDGVDGCAALFDRPTQLLDRNFSVPDGLIAISWGASPTLIGNTLLHGAVGIHFADCFIPEGQLERNRIHQCSSWGMYLGRHAVVHCINNDVSRNAGGIRAQALESIVERCTISRNAFYGVMVFDAPTTFVSNLIDGSECGAVFLKDCTGMRFLENTLRQHTVCAVEVVKQATCRLERNIIINNRNAGCLVSDNSHATLDNNTFKENDTNVMVRGQSDVHMIRNTLVKAAAHSVLFMEQSGGIMEHNDVSEGPTFALIAIVQKSHPVIRSNFIRAAATSGILVESHATPYIHGNQLSSLRDGIRVRVRGDPIVEENDIQSCTNGLLCEENGLCQFANNTLRTCAYAFVTCRSGGFPTVRGNDCRASALYGFAIEDGGQGEFEKNHVRDCATGSCRISGPATDALLVQNRFVGSNGFGLLVEHFAKATVCQNTFTSIKTFAMGSADDGCPLMHHNHVYSSDSVGVECKRAGGLFHDNVLEGCQTAAVHVKDGATAVFRTNRISNNMSEGIQISKGARCTFDGDLVEKNNGSGVLVDGDANATELRHLKVHENKLHGVKAVGRGSCTVLRCTVQDNEGDGVHLSNAGDIVFNDCSITRHDRCVVCREGGQGVLEGCAIGEATADSVVYVLQEGHLTLSNCTIFGGARAGLKTASRGKAHCNNTSFKDCHHAGIEVHADSCVVSNGGQVEDCANGIVFAPLTSAAEVKDTTSTVYAAAAQATADALRRRSTRGLLKRVASQVGRSLVAGDAKKPQQTPTTPSASGPSEPSSTLRSLVSFSGVPKFTILDAPSPESPKLPLMDPSRIANIALFNNKECGILCLAGSRGEVHDSRVQFSDIGICYTADAGVVCSRVACSKIRMQGLTVEGTPSKEAAVVDCELFGSLGLGVAIRNVGPEFTITGCNVHTNDGGGIVLSDSRCRLLRCKIEKQETFGLWFTACDKSILEECVVESNKENNAVLLGSCCPTFLKCLIRNSEHGFAVLEGSSLIMRQSTVNVNRIGFAIYDQIETLDHPAPLADNEWNERFRAGGVRRRSSVGNILKTMSQGDLTRHRSLANISSPRNSGTALRGVGMIVEDASPTDSPVGPALPAKWVQGNVLVEDSNLDHNSIGFDTRSTTNNVRIVLCKMMGCMTNAVIVHPGAHVAVVKSRVAGSGAGVLLHSDADGQLEETTFVSNRVGVFVDGNSRSIVDRCTFTENTEAGVLVSSRVTSVVILANYFHKNNRFGIDITGRSLLTVLRNEFENEHVAMRIRDQSCPVVAHNQFRECRTVMEIVGARTRPRVVFNMFLNNIIGIHLDERSNGDIARNVFRGTTKASIDINHYADPTVVQNLFEEHLEVDAVAVRVGSNGVGVVGNNKFVNNCYGLRVGCNSEGFVAMLNSFEQHTHAAALFTEAAAGHFTRNQCSGNARVDVNVAGGPSLAGLFINRNGFVVAGIGVKVEGRCINPCVIRENRFFGSSGIGIATTNYGHAIMSENLLHCLDEGIQFGLGGQGQALDSLICGCHIGLHAMAGCDASAKEVTVLANSGHAVLTDHESKLALTACRVGIGAAQKPLLLLKGGGEITSSFMFGAHTIVQCVEHTTVTIQRSVVQHGKIGMMMMPDSNATIRSNCVHRNDVGVCITAQARGVLEGNSIYSNLKSALQVTVPHRVAIQRNYCSQDNDSTPSVSGISGPDLGALVKANNAVGHGGRSDGSEKHLVPPSVSRTVGKDDVLVAQLHRFLNALGVPPTDSLSAMSSEEEQKEAGASSGSGGGFNYAALVGSAVARVVPASVIAAEDRVLDLVSRLDAPEGPFKAVAGSGGKHLEDDTVMRRLAKVSWDVRKPLAKRKSRSAEHFEWYDPSDDDGNEDDDDDDDTESSGDEGGPGGRGGMRSRRKRKTAASTRRKANVVGKVGRTSKRQPAVGNNKGVAKPAVGEGAGSNYVGSHEEEEEEEEDYYEDAADIAERNRHQQDAMLETFRIQQEEALSAQRAEREQEILDACNGAPEPSGAVDDEDSVLPLGRRDGSRGTFRQHSSRAEFGGDSGEPQSSEPASPLGEGTQTRDDSRTGQRVRSSISGTEATGSPTGKRNSSGGASMARTNSKIAIKDGPSRTASASFLKGGAPTVTAKKKSRASFLQRVPTNETKRNALVVSPSAKHKADRRMSNPMSPMPNPTSPMSPSTAAKKSVDDAEGAKQRLSSYKGVWLVLTEKQEDEQGNATPPAGGNGPARRRSSSDGATVDEVLNKAPSLPSMYPAVGFGATAAADAADAAFHLPIVTTDANGNIVPASDMEHLEVAAVILIPAEDGEGEGLTGGGKHDEQTGNTRVYQPEGQDDAVDSESASSCNSQTNSGELKRLEGFSKNPLDDIKALVERRMRLNTIWHQGHTQEERDAATIEQDMYLLHAFFKALDRGTNVVMHLTDVQGVIGTRRRSSAAHFSSCRAAFTSDDTSMPVLTAQDRIRPVKRQPGREWLSMVRKSRGDVLAALEAQSRAHSERVATTLLELPVLASTQYTINDTLSYTERPTRGRSAGAESGNSASLRYAVPARHVAALSDPPQSSVAVVPLSPDEVQPVVLSLPPATPNKRHEANCITPAPRGMLSTCRLPSPSPFPVQQGVHHQVVWRQAPAFCIGTSSRTPASMCPSNAATTTALAAKPPPSPRTERSRVRRLPTTAGPSGFDIARPHETSPFVQCNVPPLPHNLVDWRASCGP